jgi:sugar phosphate isomerase/epimerase
VKLGVFTVVFGDLPLTATLDRVGALELDAVEIGTGH